MEPNVLDPLEEQMPMTNSEECHDKKRGMKENVQ
jgi:hypothetical protein